MGHSVHDWLALHRLADCRAWREALEDALRARAATHPPRSVSPPPPAPDSNEGGIGLSAEAAWAMAASAMREAYPHGAEAIGRAERGCECDFAPGGDQKTVPYTMPAAGGRPPFVRVQFRGRPGDLLTVAHEFGHAVQLMVCDGHFVSPVVRETAAFLSELALLGHLRDGHPALYARARAAWLADDRIYLDQDGQDLLHTLHTPCAAYQYRLNYPLARLAAVTSEARLPMALRWAVFRNRLPLHALVGEAQAVFLDGFAPFSSRCPATAARLWHYRDAGAAVHWNLEQRSAPVAWRLHQYWASRRGTHAPVTVRHADRRSCTVDYFAALGMCLELLATSSYHRRFRLERYFNVEILPALKRSQVRLYLSRLGQAEALVTWAWLSDRVCSEVHASGRALKSDDWASGPRLFFNDGICRNGALRAVSHDLAHHVFPDRTATSVRRNPDASARRINHWTGVNLRTPLHRGECPG